MNFKRSYSSIPILIVGLAVGYLLFFTGCMGIIEIYSSIFLVGGLLVFLIAYYIYSVIIYFIYKERVNGRPLFLTFIFVLVFASLFYVRSNKKEPKVNLAASNHKPYGAIDLRLKEGDEVEFYYGHIEEKCSCEGKYSLKGDTLTISEVNKPLYLDISNKYLITKLYVIPMNGNQIEKDSSKYLKISR